MSGTGQLRPVAGVPSTITGVTDEELDGCAKVYIIRGLGDEHPAADPASPAFPLNIGHVFVGHGRPPLPGFGVPRPIELERADFAPAPF